MPLKDLSGKTVYDLEFEDFEKLFCRQCHEYDDCNRDDKKILGCKAFVDSGLWDKFYRKRRVDKKQMGKERKGARIWPSSRWGDS